MIQREQGSSVILWLLLFLSSFHSTSIVSAYLSFGFLGVVNLFLSLYTLNFWKKKNDSTQLYLPSIFYNLSSHFKLLSHNFLGGREWLLLITFSLAWVGAKCITSYSSFIEGSIGIPQRQSCFMQVKWLSFRYELLLFPFLPILYWLRSI